MHETRIRIRWRDMDAYGHVNNGVYLTYLEECRDAWAQELLGSADGSWDFVLAHIGIDYRNQLTQADGEVVVRCRLASIGRSSENWIASGARGSSAARLAGAAKHTSPQRPASKASIERRALVRRARMSLRHLGDGTSCRVGQVCWIAGLFQDKNTGITSVKGRHSVASNVNGR